MLFPVEEMTTNSTTSRALVERHQLGQGKVKALLSAPGRRAEMCVVPTTTQGEGKKTWEGHSPETKGLDP